MATPAPARSAAAQYLPIIAVSTSDAIGSMAKPAMAGMPIASICLSMLLLPVVVFAGFTASSSSPVVAWWLIAALHQDDRMRSML